MMHCRSGCSRENPPIHVRATCVSPVNFRKIMQHILLNKKAPTSRQSLLLISLISMKKNAPYAAVN
jgi:hypothetical protein